MTVSDITVGREEMWMRIDYMHGLFLVSICIALVDGMKWDGDEMPLLKGAAIWWMSVEWMDLEWVCECVSVCVW